MQAYVGTCLLGTKLQKRCSVCLHALQAYIGTCMCCCLVPNYRRDVQFVRMQCRLMLAHACLVPNYRSDVQFICSHAVDLVKDDDSMHAKTGLEHWMVRQQN